MNRKKRVRVNKVRIVLTIVGILLVVFLGLSIKNIFDLRAEQAQLKKENEMLTSEKKDLKQELKNVNDLEYIEEQARMQLKLIMPGEILYILEEENQSNGKD
ncbi:cell division protein DivIC [Clostridiales Family XIII bacterium PM5-7]